MTIDATKPTLEPHTQHFVDELVGAPPIYSLSPDEARSVLARAQSIPVGKPSAQVEDIALPVGPTGSVPIRVIRPVGTPEVLPAVMYFHGGGWVLGDRDRRRGRSCVRRLCPLAGSPLSGRYRAGLCRYPLRRR